MTKQRESPLKVSAIIPTYNRQGYVLRAIDSVLSQTVALHEIIVVDDGSTDGSAEAIQSRYGSRVTLVRQNNAGVSAARNRGVRDAKADWVAFLDSDDIWLPTKIELQMEALRKAGDGFGLCFTDCLFVGNRNPAESAFRESRFASDTKFGVMQEPSEYLLGPPSPYRMQSVLVSRSLIEEVNGFNENLRVMEDLDVLFRLTFKTRFCFVAEPLVRIDRSPSRPHGLCESFSRRDDRKYDDLRRVYIGWLKMPEVGGTFYQRRVSELLRLLCYDSTASKLREFRIGPALEEIGRLNELGDSYLSIFDNLISFKIEKVRRNLRRPKLTDASVEQ